MDPSNPKTTDLNPLGAGYAPSSSAVLPDIYDAMRGTKPWATLMGVVGLIVVGLMVFTSAGMMLAGGFKSIPVGSSVVYLVTSLLYLFPALLLVRYGRSIGAFLAAPNQVALGAALRQQKSYWRFMGISLVAVAALGALAAIVVLVIFLL